MTSPVIVLRESPKVYRLFMLLENVGGYVEGMPAPSLLNIVEGPLAGQSVQLVHAGPRHVLYAPVAQ
jgi:hypothetical protein